MTHPFDAYGKEYRDVVQSSIDFSGLSYEFVTAAKADIMGEVRFDSAQHRFVEYDPTRAEQQPADLVFGIAALPNTAFVGSGYLGLKQLAADGTVVADLTSNASVAAFLLGPPSVARLPREAEAAVRFRDVDGKFFGVSIRGSADFVSADGVTWHRR